MFYHAQSRNMSWLFITERVLRPKLQLPSDGTRQRIRLNEGVYDEPRQC